MSALKELNFKQQYAEYTWKILEHAIHEIYNHNFSSSSFEEMYRYAHNMVLHEFGGKLYFGLVTTMTYHLKEMSKSIEAAQGELFLEELNRNWAEHNEALQQIQDIFMYMDRTFIPSTHKTPVHELGLNLWRDVVIHASKTQSRLLDTLLELVHRERSGEVINRGLMRNIIKMLMDLGSTVYQGDFEQHFLEVSADFYCCESQEFVESCDCGNYLKKAERRLTEEMERVSHYLDARSEAKITNVVEKEMIESHMNRLVHMESSGLVNMLVDDKYDDLGRMYRLFRRVQNGLVIVQDVMTAYIRDTGLQLVTDPERLRDPVDFVQRLLDLKDKYDKVISLAFNNDKTFQNALKSSFEYFINLNARCPEFICLFVGDKLRKGLRGVSEEDVEVILDKVMMLVCYLQENDKEMIEGHMNRLVHMEISGLVNMLVDDKYDDLGRMYHLFRRVQNGLVIVRDVMTAYIRDTGKQLVTDPEMSRDPVDFVQRLLDLKDKYDKVIKLAFNNDKTFQNALNSSFEYVINLNALPLEFISLFVDDKYDDLGRMYSLFRKVQNGLVIVRDVMTAYIRDTGKQLVTDPERLRDPVDFVQRLLDLKDKYDKVISLAFNNDKTFQNALNSSFEYFINLNARSPEFICLFVDDKLRKGLRGINEEAVEVVLDKVMMLFRYLQEKDVFEKYYKQHLAKWLLSGKAVSVYAERSLIVKLTTECGYQFTCKLEGLFTDMTYHLKEVSKSIEAAQGELFLEELNRNWAKHNVVLRQIRDIFSYMDWTFIPCTHKTPVHELGLNLWRDVVIHASKTQSRLLDTLLELVHRERSGEVINRGLMRNIIKMLMDLGSTVYQDDFEKHFLEVSADFYRCESEEFIESCDCGNYLKKAERRLMEEMERVSHYLDARSEAKITNVVEKEMVEGHMNKLVHMESSGLVNMLVDEKYGDLGRMYSLFRRVQNGLVIVRDVMTAYIRDTGKQLVTDPERLRDPVDFVQRLLDLKDKYDKVISLAFNNDKTFQNALNSSFEYFINLNARSPEFISLFVDDKLRKGLRGVSEEDVEVVLDKVMMLFRYLQEKDVFEKYYKQHLAKRLLSGKTVSDDAERSLIVKLKTECGYQFTSKLEGMFTDMKTSQDTVHGFYSTVGPQLADSPTLTVQVLTTGSWPTQPSATCNLPAEILWVCEKFKSYYLGTHTGRRLSWQTNMGTADLKSTFGKGQKHELNVSTYQLCVLMLFNDADRLTYEEIEQATEIPAVDLRRCLQSLACVKGKNVLRKEPMSKDIAEEDAFFFNDKFTSKFFNIKIGTVVAQRETEPENVETRRRVEEDRKPQIEAAIVRIMKSRRVLDHNNIVAEVTKQLQGLFLANPVVIKRRIESLIEREFLERDKTDGKLYRYLA